MPTQLAMVWRLDVFFYHHPNQTQSNRKWIEESSTFWTNNACTSVVTPNGENVRRCFWQAPWSRFARGFHPALGPPWRGSSSP